MAGGFRFIEHMTDAIIEAHGDTLEEAFENAALGLNDTMIDIKTVSPREEITIEAEGHDLESLLFDWLDKVMLVILTEHFVMSHFKVSIGRGESDEGHYHLLADAKGEKLDLEKHRYKVEIKAVTYHEMEIAQGKDGGGTRLRFLLDL